MFVDCSTDLWLWEFSASSFYPGRGDRFPPATQPNNGAHNHCDIVREPGQVGGHNGNDSDIETEAEWFELFDEPSYNAPKNPLKMSHTVAIEVCYNYILSATIHLQTFS